MKKIITYEDSPVVIPHPDAAWNDMRNRLRDSDSTPLTAPPVRRLPLARIAATVLLLLLTLLSPFRVPTPTRRPLTAPRVSVSATHTSSSALHTSSSATRASSSATHTSSSFAHTSSDARPTSSTSETQPALVPQNLALPNPSTSSFFPALASIYASQPHSPAAAAPSPASRPEPGTVQAEIPYLLLQLGLQWTAQIPTENPRTYLDGSNGRTLFYRPLLPAAWMHLEWDQSLLEFTFDPFYSNLVPIKPYNQQQSLDTISAVAVNSLKSQALSKLFGFAAGIGYSANLGGKWWAGGGFQTIWWTRGIVSTYTLKVEQPIGGNNGRTVFATTTSTGILSKSDWSNFSTFQLNVYAQLLYNTTSGYAGFRAGFPFTVLSRNQGPTSPLRLEVFYRLPLLTRRVRATTFPQDAAATPQDAATPPEK